MRVDCFCYLIVRMRPRIFIILQPYYDVSNEILWFTRIFLSYENISLLEYIYIIYKMFTRKYPFRCYNAIRETYGDERPPAREKASAGVEPIAEEAD